MAQWLDDCSTEADRANRKAAAEAALEPPEIPAEPTPPSTTKRRKGGTSAARAAAKAAKELQKRADQLTPLEIAEQRRAYLMERLRDDPLCWRARCRVTGGGLLQMNRTVTTSSSASSMPKFSQFKGTIDYEDAYLICRYLASLRPFSQSFDVYLSQICKVNFFYYLNQRRLFVQTVTFLLNRFYK